MAYVACEDCGTKMIGSVCPNCHEELYIVENQDVDGIEFSDEFKRKIEDQRLQMGERLYRNEKARRRDPGESHN